MSTGSCRRSMLMLPAGHPPRSDRGNLVTMEKRLRVFQQLEVGKAQMQDSDSPADKERGSLRRETLDSVDRQVLTGYEEVPRTGGCLTDNTCFCFSS